MSRGRLDVELVRRGLFATRSAARNAIRAGMVSIDGDISRKPATGADSSSQIAVAEAANAYVGRGAFKLIAALDSFGLSAVGCNAIDVGASTGGFTQVLLERGAERVVALDVGRDQLHGDLRREPRVVVAEGTSVRDLDPADVGGPFDLITVDLSFISLTVVATDLARLGATSADWVVLVKPQFEVGRENLSKAGIVLDPDHRTEAIMKVVAALAGVGLTALDVIRSPIAGGSGNQEALLWLRRSSGLILSPDAFKVLTDD